MLLLPTIMWGTLGVFIKELTYTSTQIALVRTVLASVTLLIIYSCKKEKMKLKEFKANLWKLMLVGTCMAFNWIALFEAYKQTSVGIATVVYYFAPAIVIAISPFVFRERLRLHKVLGLIFALIGMCFVSFSAGVGEVSVKGIQIAFLGALLYSIIMSVNKSIKGISGFDAATVELTFAIIVLLPYNLFVTKDPWYLPQTVEIVNLLIVGIFHTGICYGMYYAAVQKIPAQTCAICSFTDPFSALFVSAIFLGEKMTMMQVMGAILILGGAILSELYREKTDNYTKNMDNE